MQLSSNINLLSPNEAYNLFYQQFQKHFDKSFLYTNNNKKVYEHKSQPWMTSSLIKACRKKSRLLKIYNKTKTIAARAKYVAYKNVLKQLIRQEEKAYYQRLFEINAHDVRKSWKIINELINKNVVKNKAMTFKINGIITQDKHTIVNEYNNYFTDIGPSLVKKIPTSNQLTAQKEHITKKDTMVLFPTDSHEIKTIISNLKRSSSCGIDQVPSLVVKSVSDSLSPVLAALINRSLTTGTFPDALKIAKINPIYKAGDKSQIENYRPISLLNTFSKIYERVFLNRLNSYINKHNILHDDQFGFRKNRSTKLALLSFIDTVTDSLDNNDYVISLFIDLSKAFDTIDHTLLLKKLHNYGIRGLAYQFLNSYLTDRFQCVEIDGISSGLKQITCGVPQGSILGPVLFLLYINDIHTCSDLLKFILFADDTTVLYSSSNLGELVTTVNRELTYLVNWFNSNKLSLNVSKTNYIIFSNHKLDKSHEDVIVGPIKINKVATTKFLGVIIDEKLTWTNHIREIEKKLASAIFVLRNIRYKINSSTALKLYDTLILPHLMYCNILWGNTYKTHTANIYRLQKRALRVCYGVNAQTNYSIFKLSNKLSIHDMHSLQTAQLIFQYFRHHHLLPKCISALFKKNSDIHSLNTRSQNNLCLHIPFAKINVRKFSTKIFAPQLWNKIPLDLRKIQSYSLFTKQYKIHLSSNMDE